MRFGSAAAFRLVRILVCSIYGSLVGVLMGSLPVASAPLFAATTMPLAANPLAAFSKLVWVRCRASPRCPHNPICWLNCTGTRNGRSHTSFRMGPVPQGRGGGKGIVPDAEWVQRQLAALPEAQQQKLFGTLSSPSPVELFVEVLKPEETAMIAG